MIIFLLTRNIRVVRTYRYYCAGGLDLLALHGLFTSRGLESTVNVRMCGFLVCYSILMTGTGRLALLGGSLRSGTKALAKLSRDDTPAVLSNVLRLPY